MKMKTITTTLLVIFLCVLIPAQIFCKENLLKNPGMEKTSGGKPDNWDTWQFNKGAARYSIDTESPREGTRYATIVCESENDARYTQEVQVKENTLYKISGWVKTENIGKDALGANISILEKFYTTENVTGTTKRWKYVEMYVKTAPGVKKIAVSLGLGGYGSINTGKACFDDIRMEEASQVPAGMELAYIEPPEPKREETTAREDMVQDKKNMFLLIITIIIILVILVIGGGIFLSVKFKFYKKLPASLHDWIKSVFSPPPPELQGIRRITRSPYLKVPAVLILVVALGLPFFLDIYESIKIEPYPGNENHYVHFAKAILEGRLDIPHKLHDIAIYNGKYYVVYPPFPVILVLPFVAIFGMKTKVTIIGVALAIICCILLYRILAKINIEKKYRLWILLAFFLGTGYWLCLRNSVGVAWFAHVVSVFAALLALHEGLGRGNGFLTGLFLGMAFLSRQLSLFFALFLIAALWTNGKRKSTGNKLFHITGFLGTLGLCVLIYLGYNYIRFGNFFDTGYSYLELGGFMGERTGKHGQFSIFHIPFNFVYMFLQGFHINYGDWPSWVTSVHEWWPIDPFGTAITFASPFIFYVIWAKWKKSLLISAWASIIIICTGTLMYYNNGWVQYNTQRFSLDFFPLLIIVIALGIQHGRKPFWKALILFSVAMNALTMLIIPPAG